MKTGIELIAEERKRQIEVEGWTAEHDDEYKNEELIKASVCYLLPNWTIRFSDAFHSLLSLLWPWDITWWKPSPENRIRELQKAGALIAAEIDRLLRKEGHQ